MSSKTPPPSIHINNTKIVQPNAEQQDPTRPTISFNLTAQFGDQAGTLEVLPAAKVDAVLTFYGTKTTVVAAGIHVLSNEQQQELQAGSTRVHIATVNADRDAPSGSNYEGSWELTITGNVPVRAADGSTFSVELGSTMWLSLIHI